MSSRFQHPTLLSQGSRRGQPCRPQWGADRGAQLKAGIEIPFAQSTLPRVSLPSGCAEHEGLAQPQLYTRRTHCSASKCPCWLGRSWGKLKECPVLSSGVETICRNTALGGLQHADGAFFSTKLGFVLGPCSRSRARWLLAPVNASADLVLAHLLEVLGLGTSSPPLPTSRSTEP